MYNHNDRGNNSGKRRYGGRQKSQGGGQKRVNPEKFNFVPFSENVLAYPDEWGGIPPENVLDPALASGEIHITLKGGAPLYVSDGERGDFFRLPSGEYAICIV
ncbi:MAG: hypothetical protein LUG44_03380, partial [Clostridiales bacterium]|nr:hypothetical protein [Clostridiales bacterium]